MTSRIASRLLKVNDPAHRRPFHWVFKVGNLKDTMQFYERIFGMRVHRNEEFDTGCDATCNGPYDGKWTKCMVGWGTEDLNFALELTYNYGIDSYEQGNDLRYIAVRNDGFEHRANQAGYEVKVEGGRKLVTSPDGYRFHLVDTDEGLAREPFLFVSLHVKDLATSVKYYTEVLGAQVFEGVAGALGKGEQKSAVLGFAQSTEGDAMRYDTPKIELVELGAEVDHKEGIGRMAMGGPPGIPDIMAEKVRASGVGKIVHGPMVLEPHKEALVIVSDPDGYEFCFCVEETFCITGGVPYIDWDYRAALHRSAEKAAKRQAAAAAREAKKAAEAAQQ